MGMLLGALIFILGMTLGYMINSREKKDSTAPEPVCGCGHHYAYHDPGTRECNHFQPGVMYSGTKSKVRCKCLNYCGPQPLPEFFAPEIGKS